MGQYVDNGKKVRSGIHSILMPLSLFEPSYPKVFRGKPEVDLVSTVWRPGPSYVRKHRFVQRKIFSCVFLRNQFSLQNGWFSPKTCIHFLKATGLILISDIWGTSMCILWPVSFFCTPVAGKGTISWNLVLKLCSSSIFWASTGINRFIKKNLSWRNSLYLLITCFHGIQGLSLSLSFQLGCLQISKDGQVTPVHGLRFKLKKWRIKGTVEKFFSQDVFEHRRCFWSH